MKRRSFLGALGAVVTGGPKTIASAIPKNAAELSLANLGIAGVVGQGIGEETPYPHPGMTSGSYMEWAKTRLRDITGMTKHARLLKYKRYSVYNMDVDTASLRSMSLSAKIARTKRVQFSRQEENESSYLKGIIEGWIKDY